MDNKTKILGVFSIYPLVMSIVFALTNAPDHFLTDSTYPTLYGWLWAVMNPFYHNPFQYQLVTVFWLCVAYAIQLPLALRGRLNMNLFMLAQITNVVWTMFQWTQNITITMFAPLVSIDAIFIVVMLLQKFPLGWSWTLNDSHVQSFVSLSQTGFITSVCQGLDYHTWCIPQPLWFTVGHHIIGLVFLGISFTVPLAYHFYTKHNWWFLDPRKFGWWVVYQVLTIDSLGYRMKWKWKLFVIDMNCVFRGHRRIETRVTLPDLDLGDGIFVESHDVNLIVCVRCKRRLGFGSEIEDT